eukprot:6385467-Pyramimonas_sp.AAC.1
MDGWPQGPRHLSGILRNTKGGRKGKTGKGEGGSGRDGQDTPGSGLPPQGHKVDTQRWEYVFRED